MNLLLYRIFFTGILSCSLFIACNIEDDRDLCCDQASMEYQYISDGKDLFAQNITSLRYFLFDEQGMFLQEMQEEKNLRYQSLQGLNTGSYTMVTVGNAAKATLLVPPAYGSSMDGFMLTVKEIETGNSDPLYYGICPFTINKGNVNQKFVTQMANVHCRLKVTVKWKNLPPVLSADSCYRMTLENCASGYELNGKDGYSLGEKKFPRSPQWNQLHYLQLATDNLELKGQFISLRYADRQLPTLRVFCIQEGKYEEITPAIDLNKAFTAWGYYPSSVERQEYKIIITVYMGGHVGVKLETEAGVLDWISGGTFG